MRGGHIGNRIHTLSPKCLDILPPNGWKPLLEDMLPGMEGKDGMEGSRAVALAVNARTGVAGGTGSGECDERDVAPVPERNGEEGECTVVLKLT